MENKSHALIAGLFTLFLGAALALAAVWLSRDTTVRIPYELVTRASIAGLSTQSAVRFRGVEVGKVERIGFDPQVPGQILVRIAVEQSVPLTLSTFATLGYQGVTGLAYIQLDDRGTNPKLLESTAARLARIEIAPGMFDTFAQRGEAILLQVEELSKRLNTLLDPANQKMLTQTLASVDAAARDIDRMANDVRPALARLPELAGAAQKTLVQLGTTGEEYARLAQRLQERGGVIDRVGTSVDQLASTGATLAAALNTGTLPRLNALVDSLNAVTLPRLNATLEAVAQQTLPRVNTLTDTAAGSVRSISRVVERVGDAPHSLIFGPGEIPPGPGERGYVAPGGAR